MNHEPWFFVALQPLLCFALLFSNTIVRKHSFRLSLSLFIERMTYADYSTGMPRHPDGARLSGLARQLRRNGRHARRGRARGSTRPASLDDDSHAPCARRAPVRLPSFSILLPFHVFVRLQFWFWYGHWLCVYEYPRSRSRRRGFWRPGSPARARPTGRVLAPGPLHRLLRSRRTPPAPYRRTPRTPAINADNNNTNTDTDAEEDAGGAGRRPGRPVRTRPGPARARVRTCLGGLRLCLPSPLWLWLQLSFWLWL